MARTNIGLNEDQRAGVVKILNHLLADEYVVYTKTRNYHWNVVGPQFNDLHKFFESQYEALNDIVDQVAERSRSLGGRPIASLAEFLKETRVQEDDKPPADARAMIGTLLADHESIVRSLRADLETCASRHKDMGTSDFLTGLMEQHEKMAWMLRAFLESRE